MTRMMKAGIALALITAASAGAAATAYSSAKVTESTAGAEAAAANSQAQAEESNAGSAEGTDIDIICHKVRDKVTAECRVSGQTITVKGTGHAYTDAAGYRYTLRAGTAAGKVLSTRRSTGEVAFSDLNTGETYYIQVQEYNSKEIFSDTQRFFRKVPKKSRYRLYKSRKKLGKAIEKKAVKREKTLIAYFTGKDMDVWDMISDRPLLALPFSYLAAVGKVYCKDKNKYGEVIRINGRRCCKYKFRLSRYQYSRKQQKKYIRKVRSLAGSLRGGTPKKVRKLNQCMKGLRYDHAEYRRWKAGRATDSPTSAYSAYAALVKKKAVCQGISEAAAIVLDAAGVKCESVGGINLRTGNGHTWNIVRSGSRWYWCDFCYSIFGADEILIGNKKFRRTHRLDKREYAEQMERVGKIAA